MNIILWIVGYITVGIIYTSILRCTGILPIPNLAGNKLYFTNSEFYSETWTTNEKTAAIVLWIVLILLTILITLFHCIVVYLLPLPVRLTDWIVSFCPNKDE